MTLADKIMTLRKQRGWSQEDLAAQLDISRQSVSKWESGASVPDLDKILKLSALFGVTTDALLKDDLPTAARPADFHEESPEARSVSAAEAGDFISLSRRLAGRMANAVTLLILSPIALLQLGGISEQTGAVTEDFACGIGLCILFLLAAAGVAVLIFNGMRLSKYNYLEKEWILLQPGVQMSVEQQKSGYEGRRRMFITVGVVLCIIAVIPMFLAAAFQMPDLVMVSSVNVLLALVAAGVNCFVRTCVVYGSFEKLLQTGDYTPEKKLAGKRLAFFPGIYWSFISAAYLLLLFVVQWDLSWTIWPVAGVLFAAIYGIARVLSTREKQ